MHYVNKVCLSSSDGTTKNGDTLDSNQWVSASFQLFTGGSGDSGTFKLQASNDVTPIGYSANPANFQPTNWVDIPDQSESIASGASALLTISNSAYRWIRAVYTRAGGSDAVTVQFFAIYP